MRGGSVAADAGRPFEEKGGGMFSVTFVP